LSLITFFFIYLFKLVYSPKNSEFNCSEYKSHSLPIRNFYVIDPSSFSPFVVIDAVWDRWAVLHRCELSEGFMTDHQFLIISRNKTMTGKDRGKAFKVITESGGYVHRLRPIKQGDDCVY